MLIASIWPGFESGWTAAWFWITSLLCIVWLRRHIDLNRGAGPELRPDEPGPQASELPKLSVLVAAKDEERNIGRCVAGLLAQDYPNFELIVINDRSSDRTGAILDEFARRDPRMRAVHVTELREGWFGKNNAMREGTALATGRWLCYSDADCAYDSPALLSSAVRFAIRERVEFLSALPDLEVGSLWERIVQPVAGAIMVFWFPPHRVNDPKAPHAYANGAFMLLSREAYEKLGGHEPVRATLNEDMHLARRAKKLGVRLRVIRAGGQFRVRMYVGFAQVWRGWSRIFYGCLGTLPRLLASVAMLSIFSVSPYVTLLLAPLAPERGGWLALAAAGAIVSQQSILWRFYALTRNPPAWALTYPIGAALCLGMTVDAMRRLGGRASTTWRGTTYRGGAQTNPESA